MESILVQKSGPALAVLPDRRRRPCICLSVRIHGFSVCSILFESSQYSISIYNYLVNRQFYEYICLIRKKGNVKLGSYM